MSHHTHNADDIRERAAAYALGGLDPAESRAFEQHLDEGCDECAAELSAFDAVVERLAWADVGPTPPHEVRGKLLARVALAPPHPGPRPAADDLADGQFDGAATPRLTRAGAPKTDAPAGAKPSAALPPGVLAVRADEGEWRATGDAGVFVKILFADSERGQYTTLVRMSPGSRLPRHRHRGTEQCLVVEGEIASGGVRAAAGDFICALQGSVHEELTTERGALFLIVGPESYDVLEPHHGAHA